MTNDVPANRNFNSRSLISRKVPGLRTEVAPPPCKVFKLNDDGTKGELIRIEAHPEFIKRRKKAK
jgi:hypothetical protein